MTIARASILALAAVLGGCGGAPAQTTPVEPGVASPGAGAPSGSEQVAPETMDQINRSLERKRPIVSHCLAIAVDNKELPKQSKGKITLEITITNQHASNVKVINASLDSQSLHDCVIKKVQEIEFPALANPYETSYTYQFEAI